MIRIVVVKEIDLMVCVIWMGQIITLIEQGNTICLGKDKTSRLTPTNHSQLKPNLSLITENKQETSLKSKEFMSRMGKV